MNGQGGGGEDKGQWVRAGPIDRLHRLVHRTMQYAMSVMAMQSQSKTSQLGDEIKILTGSNVGDKVALWVRCP